MAQMFTDLWFSRDQTYERSYIILICENLRHLRTT